LLAQPERSGVLSGVYAQYRGPVACNKLRWQAPRLAAADCYAGKLYFAAQQCRRVGDATDLKMTGHDQALVPVRDPGGGLDLVI
jgi:hypothetical protein